MIRPVITLPPDLGVGVFDWDIDWREQSAGTSVAGRRNIALGSLPRWVGAPSVELMPDAVGMFRAHRLAGRGQTGIFRMTMVDRAVFDHGDHDTVLFGDDGLFSDGTGFAFDHIVQTAVAASAGDTEITVDMSTASAEIMQGQILSHNDWPFAVVSITDDVLRVEMPLRRDIPAGDVILLRGRGLFEMVEPMTGNPSYGPRRQVRSEFRLQEWLR